MAWPWPATLPLTRHLAKEAYAKKKVVLVEEGGRFSKMGAFQMTNSALLPYQDLKDAFKDGGGIDIDTYPSELWHALDHTGCTRYRNFLMHDWLPHLKHTTQKLAQGGSMADLRCGPGRGSIELAKRYPMAKFYDFEAYHKNVSTA